MRIAPILISAVIVHVHASLITIHDTEKLPSEKPTEEQQQQAQELYKKLMSVWHNIKIKVSPFANADNIAGTSDSHLLKNYWYRSYHTAHKELEVALDPHVARFAAFQQTHNPDTTMKQRFEYALGSLHEDIHGAACIQDFAGVENEISRSIAEIIVLRAAARRYSLLYICRCLSTCSSVLVMLASNIRKMSQILKQVDKQSIDCHAQE